MRVLLLSAVLTAILALTFGDHHVTKRRGCGYEEDHSCGGYNGHHENDCGCGRDAGHGYGGYGKKNDDHHDDHDDHVYRFRIGEDFGAYEYLDEHGHLQGFHIDLLKAVCRAAGKKCAYLLDSFDHCWTSNGHKENPGIGMLDHWYDGCLGMLPSPDRLNTFNFTAAFTPNVKAALFWREKDDTDKHNLTNRKLGFIEGWAISQRCVERQFNLSKDSFHPVMFKTHKELVAALLDKKIDVMVSVKIFDTSKLGIVPGESFFTCTERGLSVMTHYYSDVIGWWNCAFARLKRTGEFRELCAEANEKHGHHGEIKCI